MPTDLSRAEALLASIDSLIAKHGDKNPDLVSELRKLREELQVALRKQNRQEAALMTLRIASWVRFVIELFNNL